MAISTGAPPSPEELFVRWRDRGDAEALGAIFDAEAPVLFKTAVVICSDPCTAEEAVQETFLEAMESADRWDEGRRVGPWLTGILRMKLLEIRRRDGRKPDPRRVPPPIPLEDPADTSAVNEEVERVRAAIRALPEPYRNAALLRWCYGLEPAEIADLRGEPPGTTWSLLSRAMAKLRKELGALAILGPMMPEPKGLGEVRRVVMERARALRPLPAPGPAAARVPALRRLPPFAAAAAILVAAGAGFLLLRSPEAAPAPETARARAAAVPATPVAAAPAPAAAEAALPAPVDLESCDRERDLHGVVLDPEGRPAAGVLVTTVYRPFGDIFFLGPAPCRERVPGPSTRTAADGTFRLALERGRYGDLRADGPGGASCLLGWRLAGERVRLRLRVLPRVVLRVVDGAGSPIPGVRLQPGAMDETGRKQQYPVVETGPDGRAVLEGLPPGTAWVLAEHATHRARMPAWLGFPEEGTRHFDLTLEPGRAVRGTVRDAKTGLPVAGAVVGEGAYQWNPVRTDAAGRFEAVVERRAGRTGLGVTAPGFARADATVPEEGEVEVALRAGVPVAGRLVDPGGAPVAGAVVACVGFRAPGAPDLRIDYAVARTAADGSFRLADLLGGASYTLVAEADSCGRLLREITVAVEPPGGIDDLGTIPLPPDLAIEGVLLDAAGEPLADGVVERTVPAAARAGGLAVESVSRRTDDLGRFRFRGCAPGEYRVSVGESPRFAAASVPVRVPEGGDARGVVLRLPPAVAVELAAVDPAGRPVAGVVLTVASGASVVQSYSDERGRARFAVEAGAKFKAKAADVANPRRWLPKDEGGIDAVADGSEVRLVLRRAGTIRGRVLGPDGAPVPFAGVACRDAATGEYWNGNAGADGAFALEVPRGRLEAWARAKGGPPSAAVEARPEESLDLILLPAGTGTLTVRVEDLEGKPVPGLALSAPAIAKVGAPVTGRGGEVVLRGLGSGETTIALLPAQASESGRAALPDGAAPPAPLRVVPDGSTVVLKLRPGVEQSGIALGPDGKPSPGAAVRLHLEDGSVAAALADDDGRWRAWIPPGVTVLRTLVRPAD